MDLKTLPKKINKIDVYTNSHELGLLTHGSVHHYQPKQALSHCSLTMTKSNMAGYNSASLHPIFRQNLPEGFNRLYIAEKLARYANVDDMYLLALQESNGIGMLAYSSDLQLPVIEAISMEDILTYKSEQPLFPQLLETYYLHNTLSGVQPKLSMSSFTTLNDSADKTTKTSRTLEQKDIIVKSFDSEFPLLTVNEFVCMQAAKHCGLNPPQTYLSENCETFIIERFDSVAANSGENTVKTEKLGYEDFTTLLKKPNTSDAKYNGSYETLLKATHVYTNDLQQVKKMYELIVFNCLIGNGDAHLKNYALQYSTDMKQVFMSPPFDITHTIIYDTIDDKMALKLAGSKEFPNQQYLIDLATSSSFRFRDAKQIIERLASGISDYLIKSEEITLFKGLHQSIEQSISKVMKSSSSAKGYRHDKKTEV